MNTRRRERGQAASLLLCFLLSLGMLLGPAHIAQAQEGTTGIVSGELTDASGGVLPGVSVVFTNTGQPARAHGADRRLRCVPHRAAARNLRRAVRAQRFRATGNAEARSAAGPHLRPRRGAEGRQHQRSGAGHGGERSARRHAQHDHRAQRDGGRDRPHARRDAASSRSRSPLRR